MKAFLSYNPFKELETILEGNIKSASSSNQNEKYTGSGNTLSGDFVSDKLLFEEAMQDVEPLSDNKEITAVSSRTDVDSKFENCDEKEEIVKNMEELILKGRGFVVADTPEYIESSFTNRRGKEIAKRLHRGDYSIQSHLDLHGFTVKEAREALSTFIMESIALDKRTVCVIHGRGRSSPVGPVLKGKVMEWLTRSPLNKWVIAFTSARLCDGGAGAMYIMLRQRPLTKKMKKNKSGYGN
ncbi:MAG: Smr/MutS family protein [Syntrophales bacterium]|nr:Smr/MutS family protein [Syntrophales bacterium]MDY0044237.1 Smr/MutS family protein [Syntrophales bacterium]